MPKPASKLPTCGPTWPKIAFSLAIGEVAHDVQDVAAADGVAVDEGDDRDRQRADLALEVEDVEARQPVAADVAAAALVAAGRRPSRTPCRRRR